MKSRVRFVSNSSSSSYLVVKLTDLGNTVALPQVLEKLGIDLEDLDACEAFDVLEEAGCPGGYGMHVLRDTGVILLSGFGEIGLLAMEIEKPLKEGLTLNQCKHKFLELLEEHFGLNRLKTLNRKGQTLYDFVQLDYGEVSDE